MDKFTQLVLIPQSPTSDPDSDWTFNGADTRDLTHCYHDYPARMIPQVAGKLLELFGGHAKYLFDPYCGSGTSLVEANIRGMNAIGTDLNPLARLIARAKTSTPLTSLVEEQIQIFNRFALENKIRQNGEMPAIEGIPNLHFWFKPDVIEKLFQIQQFIKAIEDDEVRLFFQVAFSETVRESSNTRNDEFKLYRYREDKLAKFNPDVFGIMAAKLQRNLAGYKKYKARMDNLEHMPFAKVYDFNTVMGIPSELVPPESMDIVVTSPPYGDSGTTVAYGQFSRLSAAWLELEGANAIDRRLMGAKKSDEFVSFPCPKLNSAIAQIRQQDEKRARHVTSFYLDLLSSISNIASVIKRNGYACYVVGNRKVKGVVLPTDTAIQNFFESFGFVHVNTYTRFIPNKRMPSRNSPTNVAGVLDNTMTEEYIVVMKRR